jgi:tagatose 1,6-diphosphate aldolase
VDAKQVTAADMTEFKTAVTRALTPHASAILLDPEYSLPSLQAVAQGCGVLLAYEKSGYDKTGPGRLPDLLPEYSVRRLVEAGADCVKVLMYYTPYDPPGVNDIKHAFIERIGAECAAVDAPFFLEFIGYEEGTDEQGPEFAAKKPDIVTKSMEEFSKDRYGVDVLKVEVPINMKYVEGTGAFKGPRVWTRAQAKELFQKAAGVARRPFIYLSAGVSNEVFTETLELVAESGVNWSGVLCGRATWKDGVPVYAKGGLKALEDWLADQGVKNIESVNQRLKAAKPWYSFYGVESAAALR